MTVSLAQLTRAKASDPQLTALRVVPKRPGMGRNLITIASGKGGVGKTWFAVTLTHALARAGKRVLLFDADIGLANVDIQLGLVPERDLATVVTGSHSLRDVILRYAEDNQAQTAFDIIAGRSGSAALGRLNPERLAELRNKLLELSVNYDHVVLDLAAGVDTTVTTMAGHDGMVIVVVTPDPTSLTDAYAFIKLHRQRRADADIRIVVNQAEDRHEAQRTYDTIRRSAEHFLKFTPPLLGFVHRDRNVTAGIREQALTLHRYPLTAAAEDVSAIAARISETGRSVSKQE